MANASTKHATYPSVIATFPKFSTKFEGRVPFMYLDVKGLVTTGIGNLIDSVAAAQALAWKNPDGSLCTPQQVADAWNAVKARQDMKLAGGGAFGPLTTIRLDDAAIDSLVASKMLDNEGYLLAHYPNFGKWPADAQLGLHSMAWAMGPNFVMPKFQVAVNSVRPDFKTAATESKMSETGNPGLIPRNAADFVLFSNAEVSFLRGKNPQTLYYPTVLPNSGLWARIGDIFHGFGTLLGLKKKTQEL
jgi:hypothetical protein